MSIAQIILTLFLLMPVFGGYMIFAAGTAVDVLVGFFLFFGAAVFAWAFFRPCYLVVLAVSLIPFDAFTVLVPSEATGGKSTTILSTVTYPKLILIITCVAWLARTLIMKSSDPIKSLYTDFVSLAMIGFLLVSFASIVKVQDMSLYLFFEIRYLYYFVIYFVLMINIIDDKQRLILILKLFFLAYVVVGIMGAYEIVFQVHVKDMLGFPLKDAPYTQIEERFRPLGPYGDPNFFGISMAYAATLGMGFFILQRSFFKKTCIVCAVLLFFFGIVGSGSRGALLAFLFSAGTLFLFGKFKRKGLVIVLTLVLSVIVMIGYTLSVSERSLQRFTGQEDMAGSRIRIGTTMLTMDIVKKNPLLGVGTGNYLDAYSKYLNPIVPREPIWPYNAFLLVWAENGTIGVILYTGIFCIACINLYLAMVRAKDYTLHIISATIFSLLIGLGLFANTHNIQGIEEIIWLVFSYSVILRKLVNEENVFVGKGGDLLVEQTRPDSSIVEQNRQTS